MAIPFKTLTLAELLDGPTEIDWLVEQIIPPTSSGILAGNSDVGKTWLTLELAIAVATGEDWLGHFPTRQGKVLIVDEENADLLLRVRLLKLLEDRGLDESNLPIEFLIGNGILISPHKRKGTSDIEFNLTYKRLAATIDNLKPALVIFDSLTRIHGEDENSSNKMAGLFNGVKRLVDSSGASLLCFYT